MAQGMDGEYWQRVSLITYIDKHQRAHPHHRHLQRRADRRARDLAPVGGTRRCPKRLLQSNGNHDTNVVARETWADRKAWMDYWMRGVTPDAAWGMTAPDGTIKQASVRTLFELHPNSDGELVSNGHHDATSWPLDGTRWKTFFMCAGKMLSPRCGAECEAGSDTYFSGTRRQSWLYQAGPELGPPFTSEDGPDQVMLRGPRRRCHRDLGDGGPDRRRPALVGARQQHRSVRAGRRPRHRRPKSSSS